jgi:hypothetical protein
VQNKLNNGCWLGILEAIINFWELHFSIGSLLNRKIPNIPMVSELYVSINIFICIIFLLIIKPIEYAIEYIYLLPIVFWTVYRLLEILLFLIGWIFVHDSKLNSVRRSIIGFGMNVIELSFLFLIIRIFIGEESNNKLQKLFTSLINLVTLNINTNNPLSIPGLLDITQLFIGLMILIIVVASLAGGILRNT